MGQASARDNNNPPSLASRQGSTSIRRALPSTCVGGTSEAEIVSLRHQVGRSIGRLRFRESPTSIQNLGAWAIEPHQIVPARRDGEAVRNIVVAAAELNRNRPVSVSPRRDIVERIGVLRVGLEIAFGVIDADRPEAVDRHILDVEPVDRIAVVFGRNDVEIERVLLWIAAPGRGGADQTPDGIGGALGPNIPLVSGKVVASMRSPSRTAFWLAWSQFGVLNFPGPPG